MWNPTLDHDTKCVNAFIGVIILVLWMQGKHLPYREFRYVHVWNSDFSTFLVMLQRWACSYLSFYRSNTSLRIHGAARAWSSINRFAWEAFIPRETFSTPTIACHFKSIYVLGRIWETGTKTRQLMRGTGKVQENSTLEFYSNQELLP